MPSHSERKSLTIIFSVFLFVILGTYIVTLIARGYRPSLQPSGLSFDATGLLSATSKPKSASVYVNNSLITATDDTINLSPGNYLIKIVKDGYFSWQKNIQIKKEIVYQTDAQLFRSTPDLKPITQTGAINPIISPDYSRIIYSVSSASATNDNGLYQIELVSNILLLNKNIPEQIAANYPHIDWSKATFSFSPLGTQVLASFDRENIHYLLNPNSPVTSKDLQDITPQLSIIAKNWNAQERNLIQSKIDQLPLEIKAIIATTTAQKISFSPSNDQILYLATTNTKLPDHLISPPPAQSTQVQSRNIEKDNYYVYDLKDDTNFYLGNASKISQPFWLQNSNNLVYVEQQEIKSTDYDGTNRLTLFAGNIVPQNVFPWADGSRIIVLTSPYVGSTPNLYAITIR